MEGSRGRRKWCEFYYICLLFLFDIQVSPSNFLGTGNSIMLMHNYRNVHQHTNLTIIANNPGQHFVCLLSLLLSLLLLLCFIHYSCSWLLNINDDVMYADRAGLKYNVKDKQTPLDRLLSASSPGPCILKATLTCGCHK